MNTIKNKAGVYRIVNTENGKRYYGSSKELRIRWSNHKSMMRLGTHKNPGIREDAAIYGVEAYKFEVLCYCKPEDRKRLEGAVIDQNYGKDCYNDTNGDGTPSEEHKANMRKPKSEETKAQISATLKGKPKSEEHKANMRKPKAKATCPHCGQAGGANGMKRFHFENCKHKPL